MELWLNPDLLEELVLEELPEAARPGQIAVQSPGWVLAVRDLPGAERGQCEQSRKHESSRKERPLEMSELQHLGVPDHTAKRLQEAMQHNSARTPATLVKVRSSTFAT